MKTEHQAQLIVRDLDKMTKGQRGELARWLERQARFVRPMHREFGPLYKAKLMK